MKKSVGIGITTCDRSECLKSCIENIGKHTDMSGVTIYVADDSNEYKGVAYRKNECLRALKDCDYIFLFDDDCYPIKSDWVDYFIKSGQNHLLYLDGTHTYLKSVGNIDYYKNCGGVFMFLTKECVGICGGFNEQYDRWGLEHAGYSYRIYKSGLIQHPFMQLKSTNNYIYAMDYDKKSNHKSCLTNTEKNIYYNKNLNIFVKEINGPQIKYPL